jgi:hypothetical protein
MIALCASTGINYSSEKVIEWRETVFGSDKSSPATDIERAFVEGPKERRLGREI